MVCCTALVLPNSMWRTVSWDGGEWGDRCPDAEDDKDDSAAEPVDASAPGVEG